MSLLNQFHEAIADKESLIRSGGSCLHSDAPIAKAVAPFLFAWTWEPTVSGIWARTTGARL